MNELASFVEKGGVVFVALDDEPFTFREASALAEVVGNATDEIAGVQTVVLEHPGQEGGGGRFAVSAADDQRTLAADEKLLEQLGQRAVAQFVVEHVFRLRIAARD